MTTFFCVIVIIILAFRTCLALCREPDLEPSVTVRHSPAVLGDQRDGCPHFTDVYTEAQRARDTWLEAPEPVSERQSWDWSG